MSTRDQSLVALCIGVSSSSDVWRRKRRSIERLPSELAVDLFHALLKNRRITAPSLEYDHFLNSLFQRVVDNVCLAGHPGVDTTWLAYLGGYSYMKALSLDGCKGVTSASLWHLTGLPLLEKLTIARCAKVGSKALDHILNLPRLNWLSLAETGVKDAALPSLASLTRLSHLDLGGLPVSDNTIASFEGLKHLTSLTVWGSDISDSSLPSFMRLPKLELLNLALSSITCFPVLPSLTTLQLAGCKLQSLFMHLDDHGGSSAERVEQCPSVESREHSSLQVLGLGDCQLQDFSWLKLTRDLTSIDLSGNVASFFISPLAQVAAKLKRLNLSETSVTSDDLSLLSGHAPILETLLLRESAVDDKAFMVLQMMPSLTNVDMRGTAVKGYIIDASLPEPRTFTPTINSLAALPMLVQLDLRGTHITDTGCLYLSHVSSLKVLLLNGEYLTDCCLPHLAALSRLNLLALEGAMITDMGLRALFMAPSLREIFLEDCWLLTAHGLASLQRALPLAAVHIGGGEVFKMGEERVAEQASSEEEWEDKMASPSLGVLTCLGEEGREERKRRKKRGGKRRLGRGRPDVQQAAVIKLQLSVLVPRDQNFEHTKEDILLLAFKVKGGCVTGLGKNPDREDKCPIDIDGPFDTGGEATAMTYKRSSGPVEMNGHFIKRDDAAAVPAQEAYAVRGNEVVFEDNDALISRIGGRNRRELVLEGRRQRPEINGQASALGGSAYVNDNEQANAAMLLRRTTRTSVTARTAAAAAAAAAEEASAKRGEAPRRARARTRLPSPGRVPTTARAVATPAAPKEASKRPSPLFGSYAVVDWSGASVPRLGRDSIWLAVVDVPADSDANDVQHVVRLVQNISTRTQAEAILTKLAVECVEVGRGSMLMGFDFSFGFPSGFAQALKLHQINASNSAALDSYALDRQNECYRDVDDAPIPTISSTGHSNVEPEKGKVFTRSKRKLSEQHQNHTIHKRDGGMTCTSVGHNLGHCPPWRAVWDYLSEEVVDGEGNENNRFEVAAQTNKLELLTLPDCQCTGMCEAGDNISAAKATQCATELEDKTMKYDPDRGLPELRLTESLFSASPTWKLYTTGSVGSQTLLGIPRLRALRDHSVLNSHTMVWPFETGLNVPSALARDDPPQTHDTPASDRLEPLIVLAEVYPSLIEPLCEAGEPKDAGQVRALALHLAKLDSLGLLAVLLRGPLAGADEAAAVAAVPGWRKGPAKKDALCDALPARQKRRLANDGKVAEALVSRIVREEGWVLGIL
eukprot:SM000092S24501  [mRNA]  locus=s92:326364:338627:+ [translate_table: standard]